MTQLRGITWSHTRGFLPLVAVSQRFEETNPEVKIAWDKRSLRDFEVFPVAELARCYDLMVVDHPFIGHAARQGSFLPLDEWMASEWLADLGAETVGNSQQTYVWDGRVWAIAIDAAAPVAAWRPDRMALAKLDVPETWAEVLEIARHGLVEVPSAPINCLMIFYGLCLAAGEYPFIHPDRVVSREIGQQAFVWLKELLDACEWKGVSRNPIQSLERMASNESQGPAYCLFPYGYSNYSREGYASHKLKFGDLPRMQLGGPRLTTTLGGTGLAVSSVCKAPAIAVALAISIADATIQRTLYAHSGGQPVRRSAWADSENNRITCDYFAATLPALERAFIRPRHDGYLDGFQDPASEVLHSALWGKVSAADVLATMDRLWSQSFRHA